VVHLDPGDLLEGLGEDRRLIGVGGNAFGEDVDLHAGEWLRGIDEPLHLLQLLLPREDRGLELGIDPALRGCHVREGGAGPERYQQRRC
jgi:hypothetical protein